MNAVGRHLVLGFGLALVATPAFAGGNHGPGGHGPSEPRGPAYAAEVERPDPRDALARRGGTVLAGAGRLFEAVFSDDGVFVFPMDASGKPLSADGLSGSVLLKAQRGRPIKVDLQAVTKQGVSFLMGSQDLSAVRDGSRTAIFSLQGLGDTEGTTSLWTRFQRRAVVEDHGHSHGGHGHAH